jgi:hypothetical protein
MSSASLFLCIICVLCILWIFIIPHPKYDISLNTICVNHSQIPKLIWTYWDNPDKIPKTVKLCMESWAKYNPEYKITLLSKLNYPQYITIPDNISTHPNFNDNPARFADLIRIHVLAEYGGVWIDSTILLNRPLDNWMFPRYAEYSGFYISKFTTKKEYPVIENWFFACNKGSQFMQLWRDEFVKMSKYLSVDDYVKSRKDMGVDLQKINGTNYLAMHVAAQKVLQIDKYPVDRLILRRAETGPFQYLVDAKWISPLAMYLASKKEVYRTPLMKMRGGERSIMEKYIDGKYSNEKCRWVI